MQRSLATDIILTVVVPMILCVCVVVACGVLMQSNFAGFAIAAAPIIYIMVDMTITDVKMVLKYRR